ncbi:uncharacterized protein LOC141702168 [Apium graveolens]|uniref:uncharacterized protein LOC141702168 n=1 Tax=Apium graveolens TaxID=4045 RepID=UPI003D796681
MTFIRSIFYSFLHNGEVFGDVVPQRGLRQGDPISPYLYIMCAEGLSAIIRRNEEAGLIHGCTMARGAPAISHLLFTYDFYFFFKATVAEAKARYYPKTDFLNATLGNNPSYVWRSILETQDLLKSECRRRIGNGEDTRIWQIPWFPSLQNGYLTIARYTELEQATVLSLITEDGSEWDGEILKDLFNELERELIQQIPILIRCKDDNWYWILEDRGDFSVKSGYKKLRREA